MTRPRPSAPSNVWRLARNLTPFTRGRWSGHAAWVLTPPQTLPERFRGDQEKRRTAYLATGSRVTPARAVRYWPAYDGEPVAWIDLKGRARFGSLMHPQAVDLAQDKLTATNPPAWPVIWRDPDDPTYSVAPQQSICRYCQEPIDGWQEHNSGDLIWQTGEDRQTACTGGTQGHHAPAA